MEGELNIISTRLCVTFGYDRKTHVDFSETGVQSVEVVSFKAELIGDTRTKEVGMCLSCGC